MRTKHKYPSVVGVAIFILANTVYAYDVQTHVSLSKSAVHLTALPTHVTALGLLDVDQAVRVLDTNTREEPVVLCYSLSAVAPQSALALIALGSLCEDALAGTNQAARFLNHFYDPQHNGRGLDFSGTHIDSLTWALDPQGNLANQEYSLRMAKSYLLSALTSPREEDRQQNLGMMFRTLGHVMHLVQDLAQPQHTRNDSHGVHHAYETYVDELAKRQVLPTGQYPAVSISKVDDLWHTASHSGLADYSGLGFITAGTNFTGVPGATPIRANPNFPLPDPSNAIFVARQITDPDLLGPITPSQPLHGEIRFVSMVVTDAYAGFQDINTMASSYSLFADDLQHYAGYTQFAVNSLTYREAARLLIPRAVGYSAGLVDYFFRGSMTIAPPDDGVYAIIDHSPDAMAPAGCGTPCGFRKIKLKVMNSTPNESMGAGTLLAVAKFHLNNCYEPDLSGEFGGPAFVDDAGCRSPQEFVVLSDPKAIEQLKRDFSDPSLEFSFAAPIPVNATDLHLQIIFRGALGQEVDAVAFTTLDLFEPTYLTFGNYNDYVSVYNSDGTFLRTDAYQAPGRFSLRLDLRFNQAAPAPIATSLQLDPGYYHRLAILTDQKNLPYWLVEQYVGSAADVRAFTLATSDNQIDLTGRASLFPAYVPLRRITSNTWTYESDDDGGAVYWIPGTTCVDGTTRCSPEDEEIGAVARRYPPFKRGTPAPMTVNF